MRKWLEALGQNVWRGSVAAFRWTAWLLVTAAVSAGAGLLSIVGAVVAGLVALAVSVWLRSGKTLGAVISLAAVIGGVVLFFRDPRPETRPLAACSITPLPFLPLVAPPPRDYVVPPVVVRSSPLAPWAAASLAKTVGFMNILGGATQRIYPPPTAAIECTRDTGTPLIGLDALLNDARDRLEQQQLGTTDQQRNVRRKVETLAIDLSRIYPNKASFEEAWARDADVTRIADVAQVLTNLDNEVAKLFTGVRTPDTSIAVTVRGRDLLFRERIQVALDGGRFLKIDPTSLLDAARERGLGDVQLLWAPDAVTALKPPPIEVPDGSSSIALVTEWTVKDAVVDSCRRLSVWAFEGVSIAIPPGYRATIRGEVVPTGKTEPVPVAVQVTADNLLRELRVPAYSLFVPSVPVQISDPVGANADEQVLTLQTPINAASLSDQPLWIEMLPKRLRHGFVQQHRQQLFPANVWVSLIVFGLAGLASFSLVPRKETP